MVTQHKRRIDLLNSEPQTELEARTKGGKPLSEWSDEEVRVKVAELCGYQIRRSSCTNCCGLNAWHTKDGECCHGSTEVVLPNYPSDLNAVHEAEKMLNPPPFDREQDREDDDPRWTAYSHYLAMLCPMGTYIHATARQRCEALIATLTNQD